MNASRCLLVLAIASVFHPPSHAGELTFDDRVLAQQALDRVNYANLIGVTRTFDSAVPRAVQERKVRNYLDQSVALERYWHTPVTSEMLSRELERMTQQTRMPERLSQLFSALGGDRFLVDECLARATVVDRLARNFFAFDSRIHDGARQRAELLRRDLITGKIDPHAEHPLRSLAEFVVGSHAGSGPAEELDVPVRIEIGTEELARLRAMAPREPGSVSDLREERDAFVVRVVLDERPGQSLRLATFVVEKRSWDDWWIEARRNLDGLAMPAVAAEGRALPAIGSESNGMVGCDPDDSWRVDSLADNGFRRFHTAVWTGSSMIVWGGKDSNFSGISRYYGTGMRYDPSTDTWAAVSNVGAPTARALHTAVWTGDRMIVWGGETASSPSLVVANSGGRYDPLTDSWEEVSTTGAPGPREAHTAVWTGDRMIVWGGKTASSPSIVVVNSGGSYDPLTDTWTPTALTSVPSARSEHSAVWMGDHMVIWGGMTPGVVNSGGRYDPATDTWTPTATTAAPSARRGHTAVSTGTKLLVWGGSGASDTVTNTGGRYDPATDTWSAMTLTGAPTARTGHTAVWTGNVMLVWGGSGFSNLDTGGRYDPIANSWAATPVTPTTPARRFGHTAVWTDSLMLIWGGSGGAVSELAGGRYHLATNQWTPITHWQANPRKDHVTVWTGSEMIVWGGQGPAGLLKTGGRYDPATDHWTATTMLGAPSARQRHTAVWADGRMIVWGGLNTGASLGAIYDPLPDSWTWISTVGAPSARERHTAVWDDSRMIVWGGTADGTTGLASGGLYDPVSNAWTPTPTGSAPPQTYDHTAVWTGSEMIVWGGVGPNIASSRYDPTSDTWVAMSSIDDPEARFQHTAVWTGSEMIVWGGRSSELVQLQTGGRYDPAMDSWTATSLAGAPSARQRQTAVWTGHEMLVWGGTFVDPVTFVTTYLNTGGRYDVASDSWASMNGVGAPRGVADPAGVWTGNHMVVWGGEEPGTLPSGRGGAYAWGNELDNDGDSFTECDGDCDDASTQVYPGAIEICDTLDNDCDGSPAPAELDVDGDGLTQCAGDCAPEDSGAFAVPSAITNLVLGPTTDWLSWDSAGPTSGTGTIHDVLRGLLEELPVGGGVAEACVASTSGPTASDLDLPLPGTGFWYLVRGRSVCGAGPWGAEAGDPPEICP